MQSALITFQIIISILLTFAILIQTKGTGFGKSWGGAVSFTRRGLEKLVFKATFVLTAAFIIVSILQIVI